MSAVKNQIVWEQENQQLGYDDYFWSPCQRDMNYVTHTPVRSLPLNFLQKLLKFVTRR